MSNEDAKYKIRINRMWNEISLLNEEFSCYDFNSIVSDTDENFSYQKNTNKDNVDQSLYSMISKGKKSFDYKEYIAGQMYEKLDIFKKIIDKYKEKYSLFEKYFVQATTIYNSKRLYASIETAPKDDRGWFSKNFGMNERTRFRNLKEYEDGLFSKIVYTPKFPTITLRLNATTFYNNAYKNYEKVIALNLQEIVLCYELAIQKKGKMSFVQQQRAIITDKVRYGILKRDDFKCCVCGSTAKDGLKLEVDHIIPVSKGGKSTPDNLRTLCERCNRGKSNS